MSEHRKAIDTLRIAEKERLEILAELEKRPQNFAGISRRQFRRWRYLVREIEVEFETPGSGRTLYIGRPRNLSAKGLSLLHGNFVYPQTPCVVRLLMVDGESILVHSRVMHCHCVRGKAHEIGVQFDQVVEVENFVAGATSVDEGTGNATLGYDAVQVERLARELRELAASVAAREALLAKLAELTAACSSAPPSQASSEPSRQQNR